MRGYNRVVLAGNLTRDPELRYTPTGTAIAKFGLGINRSWTDANGQQKEECTFVDVDAFGKQAETIGQYMKKGKPILLEGRLKLDEWQDKQTNQKRSRLGVVLESFTFIDAPDQSGNRQEQSAPLPPRQRPAARPSSPVPEETTPPDEEDVPFAFEPRKFNPYRLA